jgi:hypothetical protein
MSTFVRDCICRYLDSPGGFYGDSEYNHRTTVKGLAAFPNNPRDRLYDPAKKLWGTKSLKCVRRLIDSGLWYPVGLDIGWKAQFLSALDERINAVSDEASRKAAEKSATLRAESMAATGYDAQGNKILNAEERMKLQQERDRGVVPNDPKEVELLNAIGFTSKLLASIPPLSESIQGLGTVLGPSCGISTAAKVLRMIRHRHAAVRAEYAYKFSEDGKNLYFDSSFMEAEYRKNDKELISYLQQLSDNNGGKVPTDTAAPKKKLPRDAKTEAAVNAVLQEDTGGDVTKGDQAHSVATATDMTQAAQVKQEYNAVKLVSFTMCRKCKTEVQGQFLECSCCTAEASKWELCTHCNIYMNRFLQPCIHCKPIEKPKAESFSLPGLEGVSPELQATAICDDGAHFVEDVISRVEQQLDITLPLDLKEPRLEKEVGSTSGACAENAMAEQLSHVPAWVPCGVEQPSSRKRPSVITQVQAAKRQEV